MIVRTRWQTAFVAAALAVMVGQVLLSGPPRRPTPKKPAPTSAPATRPARKDMAGRPSSATPAEPAEAYPGAALTTACEEAATKLRAKLDDTFVVLTEPPFVMAGDMPRAKLKQYASGTVLAPAKALWRGYFDKKPDKVITVLLFAGDKSYRAWAKTLFNDTRVPHFGYYRPGIRTMVMNIGTGGGTLVHELTHSLIVYDFPNVPTWFDEGFASLHEGCQIGTNTIVGVVNWRLPGLQKAHRDGKLRSLRDLITKRDFRGRLEGVNYAQARYFVMYMQQKKLLKPFYKHFHAQYTAPDAKPTLEDDVKAVEHIFGQKLEDIEKVWLKWVMTLKYR
jgi:hypothetical protein